VVTADSPSLARSELREATELARRLGLRHQIVATGELNDQRTSATAPTAATSARTPSLRAGSDLRRDRLQEAPGRREPGRPRRPPAGTACG